MLWCGMDRMDFHSLDFRTALDSLDFLWHKHSGQHCRAKQKRVDGEKIIFKFLLENMHTVPFGKASVYGGKLA